MTRQQITEGLLTLMLQLANDRSDPPEGYTPHEWFYIKGVAGSAIWQLRESLNAADPLRKA